MVFKNIKARMRHEIMALKREDAILMKHMLFRHPPKSFEEALLMKKIAKRVREME